MDMDQVNDLFFRYGHLVKLRYSQILVSKQQFFHLFMLHRTETTTTYNSIEVTH